MTAEEQLSVELQVRYYLPLSIFAACEAGIRESDAEIVLSQEPIRSGIRFLTTEWDVNTTFWGLQNRWTRSLMPLGSPDLISEVSWLILNRYLGGRPKLNTKTN